MFTLENTDGFSALDLELMNAALGHLIEFGITHDNASDIVNNNWQPTGNTIAALCKI